MKQMTDEERRSVCFHEAGHAAMFYWNRESLHARRIVIHGNRYRGSVVAPMWDLSETDLMKLIGGPMAELLHYGTVPKKAIRFTSEYRVPNSDSTRIRALVRRLRDGKDDRRYQFDVQERVRAIIQEPRMWEGVTLLADRLFLDGEITGEEAQDTFHQTGVADRYRSSRPCAICVIRKNSDRSRRQSKEQRLFN